MLYVDFATWSVQSIKQSSLLSLNSNFDCSIIFIKISIKTLYLFKV